MLDTLVDRAFLDGGLTAIANAIRERGDTTARLAFPDGIANAARAIPWDFKGLHPEHVSQIFPLTAYKLKDTGFASWTPSGTATAIIASSNAGTFVSDFASYEYLLRWRCQFTAAYKSGATLKGQEYKEVAEIWQALIKRPNSLANIEADNAAGNACVTLYTVPLNVYYNTNGALAYTYAITYGIYPSATAATFANSSNNATTVTVKTPAVNARCNNSYFAAARAPELDQDKSIIKLVGDVYRCKPGAVMRSLFDSLIDLYNNQL